MALMDSADRFALTVLDRLSTETLAEGLWRAIIAILEPLGATNVHYGGGAHGRVVSCFSMVPWVENGTANITVSKCPRLNIIPNRGEFGRNINKASG